MERTAEEEHFSLDSSSLRETGYCLVNYSLKDTCSNVLAAGALIEKGLDIGFSENSSA